MSDCVNYSPFISFTQTFSTSSSVVCFHWAVIADISSQLHRRTSKTLSVLRGATTVAMLFPRTTPPESAIRRCCAIKQFLDLTRSNPATADLSLVSLLCFISSPFRCYARYHLAALQTAILPPQMCLYLSICGLCIDARIAMWPPYTLHLYLHIYIRELSHLWRRPYPFTLTHLSL
jgi:hypothetical protein